MNVTPLTKALPLFSGLPAAEQAVLAQAARAHPYHKGQTLFSHGDAASHVYIIVQGAIRQHRQTPDGKDVTSCIAIGGDMLGERDMLENRKHYQMSATALEEGIVLQYPASFLRQALIGCPNFALSMLAAIAKNSSRAAIDNEHVQTLKSPQRIGCFLLRLLEMHGFDPARFTLPYSKSTIASKLAMEPESFSRALAKLKGVGVTVQGAEVSIADTAILEEYVCSHCSMFLECETCGE